MIKVLERTAELGFIQSKGRFAALSLIAFVLSPPAHAGYGHWLELSITNPDTTAPFSFRIGAVSCLHTQPMPHSVTVTQGKRYTIPPGKRVVLGFNHDPGSRCDGAPADFSITFGTDSIVYFRAFENGEVTLNSEGYRGEKPYVGQPLSRDGFGNSEGGRWDWQPKLPPDKLGKAAGHWVNRCPDVCSEVQITTGISSSDTSSKQSTSERATMMSTTAQAGIEFPGASASVSVTASEEMRVGSAIGREISTSRSSQVTQTFPKPAGWNNLWQWVVVMTKLRSREELTYESTKFTCTMTDAAPGYLPESAASRAGNCLSPPPGAAALRPSAQPEPAPVAVTVAPKVSPVQPATSAYKLQIFADGDNENKYFVDGMGKVVKIAPNGSISIFGQVLPSQDPRFAAMMQTHDGKTAGIDQSGDMWAAKTPGQPWGKVGRMVQR